jgi:hypothetical protein
MRKLTKCLEDEILILEAKRLLSTVALLFQRYDLTLSRNNPDFSGNPYP